MTAVGERMTVAVSAVAFWWERPPGRDGVWLGPSRRGRRSHQHHPPSFPRRRESARTYVIPAKAGIHRASWIVAGSMCSLRYRLDPRLREDDVCRGKDDEGVGGFTLLVGAPAWARGGWLGPSRRGRRSHRFRVWIRRCPFSCNQC